MSKNPAALRVYTALEVPTDDTEPEWCSGTAVLKAYLYQSRSSTERESKAYDLSSCLNIPLSITFKSNCEGLSSSLLELCPSLPAEASPCTLTVGPTNLDLIRPFSWDD